VQSALHAYIIIIHGLLFCFCCSKQLNYRT